MQALRRLFQLIVRIRYPVTIPGEIAKALGVKLSNRLTVQECIDQLKSSTCNPTRLSKYMPRKYTEEAFNSAQRKEHFKDSSLYSYYFNEGWLEFALHFDDISRLRRIYIHHKAIKEDRGIEIGLHEDTTLAKV